jgi:hypothetical protein
VGATNAGAEDESHIFVLGVDIPINDNRRRNENDVWFGEEKGLEKVEDLGHLLFTNDLTRVHAGAKRVKIHRNGIAGGWGRVEDENGCLWRRKLGFQVKFEME